MDLLYRVDGEVEQESEISKASRREREIVKLGSTIQYGVVRAAWTLG